MVVKYQVHIRLPASKKNIRHIPISIWVGYGCHSQIKKLSPYSAPSDQVPYRNYHWESKTEKAFLNRIVRLPTTQVNARRWEGAGGDEAHHVYAFLIDAVENDSHQGRVSGSVSCGHEEWASDHGGKRARTSTDGWLAMTASELQPRWVSGGGHGSGGRPRAADFCLRMRGCGFLPPLPSSMQKASPICLP
jgi:hypothetical protein